jgi:hypothetical protein
MRFKLKIFWSRLYSVKKEIGITATSAFISILLIELCLNKIPPYNIWIYDLGQVYLRLSYSFFSAFIFYFLGVHLPKERRKAKAFIILNNKTKFIRLHINSLLVSMFTQFDKDVRTKRLSNVEIQNLCKKINPRNSFTTTSGAIVTFDNYYLFINFMNKKIKTLISDVISLGDVVDNDLLQNLSYIDDILTKLLEV